MSDSTIFKVYLLWAAVFSALATLSMGEGNPQSIINAAPPPIFVTQGKKCKIGKCVHPEMLPASFQCIFNACGPDGRGSCCVDTAETTPAPTTTPVPTTTPSPTSGHSSTTPKPSKTSKAPVLTETTTQSPQVHLKLDEKLPQSPPNIRGRVFSRAMAPGKDSLLEDNSNIKASESSEIAVGHMQRIPMKYGGHSSKDLSSTSYSTYGAPKHSKRKSKPACSYSSLSCICTPIQEYEESYFEEDLEDDGDDYDRSYDHTMPQQEHVANIYDSYYPRTYSHVSTPPKQIHSYTPMKHVNQYTAYSSPSIGKYGHMYA